MVLIMKRYLNVLAVALTIAAAAASGCMETNIESAEGTAIRFGASAYYHKSTAATRATDYLEPAAATRATDYHEPAAAATRVVYSFDPNPATRTSYSGEIIYDNNSKTERIDWANGDHITVYSEQSPEKSAVYKVEGHSEEGKTSYASITSLDESGNGLTWGHGDHVFYAAYPSEKAEVNGHEITGEVPSNQEVTTDGETFSTDMSLALMWAAASAHPSTSSSVRLNFHPMVTAFRFTLYGKSSTPQTLQSFTLSSSEGPLAGKIRASIKEDLNEAEYEFSETSERVSVDLKNAEITSEKSVTFTLFCLPRNISSLTATLETSDGKRRMDFKKSGEWVTFQGGTKIDIRDLTVVPPSTNFEGTSTGSFSVKIVKLRGFTSAVTVETVTVTPDETGFFSVNLPPLPDGTHYIIEGSTILNTVTKMPDIISKDGSIQKLFYNCKTLVSTCNFNTAGVTEFLYGFYNCEKLLEGPDIDTSSGTVFDQLFRYCRGMKRVPNYDFSSATSISYTFDYCTSLQEIPCFNLGTKPKTMNYTFHCCESVKELPPLDFSSATSIDRIFRKCTSIKEIPAYDFSSVKSMRYAFSNCSLVESLPNFNMGTTLKTMEYAFEYCRALKDVSRLDISHVTNMEGTFQFCSSLTEVPQLDYSSVKTLRSCFQGCRGIVSIPAINTPNVTNWMNTFYYCTSLKDVTPFDTSASTNCEGMFWKCPALESLPWFDLSKCRNCLFMLHETPLSSSQGFGAIAVDLDLTDTYLDKDSMVRIFQQAATVSGKKFTLKDPYINHSLYEKLTEEDIAIATDKGWSIVH